MTRKQWPCMLCDKIYAECEEAEQCERDHGLEHDAYCPCESCRMERARDTSEEYAHD